MDREIQTESAPQASVQRTHVRFGDWTGKRPISMIGTNSGSQALLFQMWRRFKEVFTPELVERVLSETPGTVRHIADPFGGSGTTALAFQLFGVKPTTIEVNSFLVDLIEAKIALLDFDVAVDAFGKVVERVASGNGSKRLIFPNAPTLDKVKRRWSALRRHRGTPPGEITLWQQKNYPTSRAPMHCPL